MSTVHTYRYEQEKEDERGRATEWRHKRGERRQKARQAHDEEAKAQ